MTAEALRFTRVVGEDTHCSEQIVRIELMSQRLVRFLVKMDGSLGWLRPVCTSDVAVLADFPLADTYSRVPVVETIRSEEGGSAGAGKPTTNVPAKGKGWFAFLKPILAPGATSQFSVH